MKYTGLLLKEGLQDETVLQRLVVTNTEIWDAENAEGDQPKQWTAIYFEVDEEKVDEIAKLLSKTLKPKGWYLNILGKDIVFVVLPNKVFKYKKGDTAKRIEAVEYGRMVGIPESQLDWQE